MMVVAFVESGVELMTWDGVLSVMGSWFRDCG